MTKNYTAIGGRMRLWIAPYNKVFVKEATVEEEQLLDEELSYTVDTTHLKLNYNWDGVVHLFNAKKKYFPVGLLQRALDIFNKYKVKYTVHDARLGEIKTEHMLVKELSLEDSPIRLRDYQKRSVEKAVEQVNSILQIAVGGGKTYVGCKFVQETCFTTLIVVPNTSLVSQWKKSLTDFFPSINPEIIGVYGDGSHDIKPITIATYQGLTYDEERMKPYKNYFKTIIYDECHGVQAKVWRKLGNMFSTYFSLGLSATAMSRGDKENMLVESVCGPMIVNISPSRLTVDGHLSKVKILTFPVAHDSLYLHHAYSAIIDEAIVNNEKRNQLISRLTLRHLDRVGLILTTHVRHGENIQRALKPLLNFDVPFITGKTDKKTREEVLNKMRKGELRLAIATKVFEQGIDIPNLSVLYLVAPTKSAVKTMQQIGRVTRLCDTKEMLVYDLTDKIKYLNVHAKERLKLYQSEPEWVVEEAKE